MVMNSNKKPYITGGGGTVREETFDALEHLVALSPAS